MTYRDLLHALPLNSFQATGGPSAEWLDQDVTVHGEVLDEFSPVIRVGKSEPGDPASGVLDAGHLYLEYDG